MSLCAYECRVVPGLLQSEAYARAVFRNQVPPLDDEQVEQQLTARLERQELLRARPNTAYSFIVEEALLLRQVGGAEVTRGLIDHVLAVCRGLRNVEVQVMPLRRRDHAGSDGPVQLLETPEHRWIAYVEGQRGGWLHSDAKEVSVLQMRYARMRTQALTPEDTVGLLERLRGAL